ncbi:MAG: hypothetical protein WC875_05315 [Candidatus Absconditabacterales bacterium]
MYDFYGFLTISLMFEHFEKKINKRLLNFVIGGSYMGEQGQHFVDYIKNFFIDAYDHLKGQWKIFQKWYSE